MSPALRLPGILPLLASRCIRWRMRRGFHLVVALPAPSRWGRFPYAARQSSAALPGGCAAVPASPEWKAYARPCPWLPASYRLQVLAPRWHRAARRVRHGRRCAPSAGHARLTRVRLFRCALFRRFHSATSLPLPFQFPCFFALPPVEGFAPGDGSEGVLCFASPPEQTCAHTFRVPARPRRRHIPRR